LNTRDRRRWEELHADRQDIDRAARWLRDLAWQESYAGFKDKDRAFMVAMLLDTLSIQLDRVDSAVGSEAVRVSRWMLGERGT
jgi:hypothetical protein